MNKEKIIDFISRWSWILIAIFLGVGWVYPIIGTIALICMLAPVIVAAWKGGRIWCGFFCPRGSLNDNVLGRVSRSVEIPKIFKAVWFRAAFFIFLIYNFVVGIINASGNWIKIGFVFYRIIFITSSITIIFGIIFHERTWCTFCPMGSLSALLIKIRRKLTESSKRIKVDKDKCVDCKVCETECPMGLTPYDFTDDNHEDLDCLHCEQCVYACPVSALARE